MLTICLSAHRFTLRQILWPMARFCLARKPLKMWCVNRFAIHVRQMQPEAQRAEMPELASADQQWTNRITVYCQKDNNKPWWSLGSGVSSSIVTAFARICANESASRLSIANTKSKCSPAKSRDVIEQLNRIFHNNSITARQNNDETRLASRHRPSGLAQSASELVALW